MAELIFKSPIRRDKWPRWITGLHKYLKKIYAVPVQEADYDDYDRLRRIIADRIVALRKDKLIMKNTETFTYIEKRLDGTYAVCVRRNNDVVITYYIE